MHGHRPGGREPCGCCRAPCCCWAGACYATVLLCNAWLISLAATAPPAPVSLSSCCIFSYSHWGDASMQERARGYKKKNFIQAKYDFIDEMFKWSGSATPEKVSRGGGSVDPGVLARCAI